MVAPGHPGEGLRTKNWGVMGRGPENLHFHTCWRGLRGVGMWVEGEVGTGQGWEYGGVHCQHWRGRVGRLVVQNG